MTSIWVYKADGTIQCEPPQAHEITLSKMRTELETLIGSGNVLSEQKRPSKRAGMTVCGSPTGQTNAYKISPEGLNRLFSGIAGPSGFEVDPDSKIQIDPNDAVTPWPLTGSGDDPVFPWPTKLLIELAGGDRWVPWPWIALAARDEESAARTLANVVAYLLMLERR
ncbi:hypothetical protein LJR098_003358 [Rhizobium sp. LjRoot98]|uniref:hypothetical protein n=1 Tax=Rhizobium sp. LjRoot98 TaxID=3342345 RepID=UPI003ED10F1B